MVVVGYRKACLQISHCHCLKKIRSEIPLNQTAETSHRLFLLCTKYLLNKWLPSLKKTVKIAAVKMARVVLDFWMLW